jgi:hypothetical protein
MPNYGFDTPQMWQVLEIKDHKKMIRFFLEH